jgi:murein DD-endopeptidase MepM/ murein hydrolase activator NlpD
MKKRVTTAASVKSRSNLIWLLPVLLGLLWLVGCQSTTGQVEPLREATTTPSPLLEEALPMPNTAGTSVPGAEPPASEAPLRFTLPTPGPVPASLWRPPLYDAPWALGPNDHFYFTRPIAADKVNWPLADYRYGGIFFGPDIVHTGIDIPAPRHTPVLASANGKVIWAGYGLFYGNNNPEDPYGLAVSIRHDFGFQGQQMYTIYAHLGEIMVTTGQDVQVGDILGLVGTTGLTTGPHLHFEVRVERNSYYATLNPELWLAPPQGWGVLVGRVVDDRGLPLAEKDVHVRNLETRQNWVVRSYGNKAVNSDPYYNENVVLSDLPAGKYEISLKFQEEEHRYELEIRPGAVSYFKFHGKLGFDTILPQPPFLDPLLEETQP